MPAEVEVSRGRDDWIEVPAETDGGVSWPLKLRVGTDAGKVRLPAGAVGVELDIDKLRQGLDLIEEEHRR